MGWRQRLSVLAASLASRGVWVRSLGTFGVDLRLGFRMLIKHPGLTVVALFAVSLAVAGSAGFFAFTNNFLTPELPLHEGDRVVAIQNWNVASSAPEPRSLHDFVDWRDELDSVEDLGAFAWYQPSLTTDAAEVSSETIRGAEISASGFQLARVPPLLGRPLVEADERPGADAVVVLGYDLWQGLFAADSSVVGRSVRLSGSTYTIVGVMPEGFRFPFNQNLWIPLKYSSLESNRLAGPPITAFGRLKDGVTIEEAQAELSVLGRQAAAESPETHEFLRPRIVPYAQALLGGPTTVLLVARTLFVMFLIFISANVGALVFVRNLGREGEMTLRAALGAGRGRIVAQLFLETLVLVMVGAIVGLALAAWGLRLASDAFAMTVMGSGVSSLPFWWREGLGPRIVYYVAALTLLSAVVAGLPPALTLSRLQLRSRLQRAAAGGFRFGRRGQAAITVQVALCVGALTVVVGEWPDMVMSVADMEGLAAEEYLMAELQVDESARSNEEVLVDSLLEARRELARRLIADPDVIGVTFASALPGLGHPERSIEVGDDPDSSAPDEAQIASVDSEFFDVFGVPVLAGRTFDPGDLGVDGSDRLVAIVNESFARRRLGGVNALGKRVRFASGDEVAGPWLEIIGVVGDFGMNRASPTQPEGLYVPLAPASSPVRVAVHQRTDPAQFVPRLRSLVAEVAPALRLRRVTPLDAAVASGQTSQRVYYVVTLLVSGTLLVLSLSGVYAVVSFLVSQRTREIGIRRALGARPGRVVFDVASRTLFQVGLGAVIGSVLTVPFSAIAMEVGNVSVALKVSALLVVAGLLACAAPTWRILQVEPTEAMKAEG